MPAEENILVIEPAGTARKLPWPKDDAGRKALVAEVTGSSTARMLRCGKGILAFSTDFADPDQAMNEVAMEAFAEQDVRLAEPLVGAVLFARNPSKGSIVKPLTDAQAANLLVVTGARLT